MHIHILGIAGTFMGSLAMLAKQLGHQVTGMDQAVYPPMSTQLNAQNINYTNGYRVKDLPQAEVFIIGNALSRGNACVEEILKQQYPYTSGAQWLSENVLQNKWVLAVSGTHGKTSTASMLAWILEFAGYNPNFLIGGVAENFGVSSRLTESDFFVIEADEYDTAFFDKRSKFIHYRPKTLLINNLEFDHADIFDTLADIQKQFHHLVRTLPQNGLILYPQNHANIEEVFDMGVFSKLQPLPKTTITTQQTGSQFKVGGGEVSWNLLGVHNVQNALGAIYSAHHAGVPMAVCCEALKRFKGVKRRLEIKYQTDTITIYDDFAHHPTAIKSTLLGLRAKVGNAPIIVILELRSNTMKSGIHQQTLPRSLTVADQSLILKPENINWDIEAKFAKLPSSALYHSTDEIISAVSQIKRGHIVVMSNGGFDDLINKLIKTQKAQP